LKQKQDSQELELSELKVTLRTKTGIGNTI